MDCIEFSFADPVSGVLARSHCTGSRADAERIAASAGFRLVDGRHDPLRVRLDVDTGELVSYVPPQPADDEWQTWAWNEELWAWTSTPTALALGAQLRTERDRRLDAVVKDQLKAIRTGQGIEQVNAYIESLLAVDISGASEVTWPARPAL